MRGAMSREAIDLYAIFASIPFTLFAQQGSVTEREALARNFEMPGFRSEWTGRERE